MKKYSVSAISSALLVLAANSPVFAEGRNINLSGPADIGNISPNALITFVINAFFAVAVLAALIYLLWGGLNWILSGGDKDKIDAARSRIIAAIIGLVLVVLAYVILNFVMVILGFEGGIGGFQLPTLRNQGVVVSPAP